MRRFVPIVLGVLPIAHRLRRTSARPQAVQRVGEGVIPKSK
jgi:hypothetical protein